MFTDAVLTDAIYTNVIQADGHINGLDLAGGEALLVRDYGDPTIGLVPLPVTIDQHFAMGADGTLRMTLEADAWNSTISFAAGIPIALGGTLELTFAEGANIAIQVGRTIDLFDWTGVSLTGAFDVVSPYVWNLSNLYTTSEVTLTALSALVGDYDGSGTVGPEDYDLWKASFGSTSNLAADGNGDHTVDAADYTIWRNNLGATLGSGSGAALPSATPLLPAVPEPSSLALIAVGLSFFVVRRWRSDRSI